LCACDVAGLESLPSTEKLIFEEIAAKPRKPARAVAPERAENRFVILDGERHFGDLQPYRIGEGLRSVLEACVLDVCVSRRAAGTLTRTRAIRMAATLPGRSLSRMPCSPSRDSGSTPP
jgi:hypothetical protein